MLNDNQLKTLCETLLTRGLLGFKPVLEKLRYDQTDDIEWEALKKPGHRYLYVRTHPDSKILAVAHTDHVGALMAPKLSYDRRFVLARQLDDRLGCWLLLHYLRGVLPADQPYDILLTDFEERGESTARWFTPPKDKSYNWMFEWDRRGSDVVMYDYKTKELDDLLHVYGFRTDRGSFTDICNLAHLGCAGFNFGTGYHREHSEDCYADLGETFDMVSKFIPFYSEWYGKHLKHDHEAAMKKKNNKELGYGWDNKKKDTHTGGGRSPSTSVVGGLNIGEINNHRCLPPIDMTTKHHRRRTPELDLKIESSTTLTTPEIHSMDDDEYLMWCSFVNSNKHNDNAIKEAAKLHKEWEKMQNKLLQNKCSDAAYAAWIEQKILQYKADVLNPQPESLIDNEQRDFWLENQRERENQQDLWQEYLYSDCVDISFADWKRNREIALAGGFQSEDDYDNRDSYFKHQAKQFDKRHGIGSDDDTDLMSPSDEDLLALEMDEELKARIMEDPLYSSDQFPGGKEARSQHFDNLPNDLT